MRANALRRQALCDSKLREARKAPSPAVTSSKIAFRGQTVRELSTTMPGRSASAASTIAAARSTSTPAAASSSSSPSDSETKKVLMVCLGNICRSPAAEAVLAHLVKTRKLGEKVAVDSCGTGGGSGDWYRAGGFSYHEGDAADSRMRSAASRRGIAVTSRSRSLTPRDLEEFDVVVAMDAANHRAISTATEHWLSEGKIESRDAIRAQVRMMTDFLRNEKLAKVAGGAVPDPYYGGEKGFELVLDLLEDACEGLLEEIL